MTNELDNVSNWACCEEHGLKATLRLPPKCLLKRKLMSRTSDLQDLLLSNASFEDICAAIKNFELVAADYFLAGGVDV